MLYSVLEMPNEATRGFQIEMWGVIVRRNSVLLVCVMAGLAAWCTASMKLLVNWKNPNYTGGSFKKILVLGLNGKAEGRADFEDGLVAAISRPGEEADPSYQYLPRPDATPIDVKDLKALIEWQKFDAVVVARLTKASAKTVYVPGEIYSPVPYYRTFYGYYGALYPVVYTPGYLKNEKKAQVEVNLYSTAKPGGELVWTGTTENVEVKSVKKAIKDLVKAVTEEWEEQKIIETKPG
jgi:hypothetical protein